MDRGHALPEKSRSTEREVISSSDQPPQTCSSSKKTQVPNRPDRFGFDESASRQDNGAVTGCGSWRAQLPSGVGSSSPLVPSRISGAGGTSSPAIAGLSSEGTEAMVGTGLAERKVCWPAP